MKRPSGDREFMALAIEEMQRSSGRGPKVGAILVKDEQVVATGHRQPNLHAERDAIQRAVAAGLDLREATLYTTLEPCVNLGGKTESCADLILRHGIVAAVIGRYDPNPRVYREGWKTLRDGNVTLRDFDGDLRAQIDKINATFAEHFVAGVGPTGGAKFDYLLNGGNFEIQFAEHDERSIVTRWSSRSEDSVHAYANRPVEVALARHAAQFDEIDDPTAFDFDYHAPIKIGEIAVFVSEAGAVLVKVVEVHAGPERRHDHTAVKIEFEVRPW